MGVACKLGTRHAGRSPSWQNMKNTASQVFNANLYSPKQLIQCSLTFPLTFFLHYGIVWQSVHFAGRGCTCKGKVVPQKINCGWGRQAETNNQDLIVG